MRKIYGKDLTAMTVDATILTARHNQSKRSFSTLVCQAFFAKYHKKPRDHDAYRHRRTSSSRTAYPSLPCKHESLCIPSLLLSPQKLCFCGDPIVVSVMVFLRSVWCNSNAPPGNNSNAPPGRMKNGKNFNLHTRTEEIL